MKMAEILRKLADIVDSGDLSSNSTMSRTKVVNVEKPEDAEGSVMVPPLQSKLELLKKSEGLPNVYDEEGSDELYVIKKNAGLARAAQIEASEDNDITG
jgi:hypothetical protein